MHQSKLKSPSKPTNKRDRKSGISDPKLSISKKKQFKIKIRVMDDEKKSYPDMLYRNYFDFWHETKKIIPHSTTSKQIALRVICPICTQTKTHHHQTMFFAIAFQTSLHCTYANLSNFTPAMQTPRTLIAEWQAKKSPKARAQ